ncbi:IGHMBP2 family helicase [Acidaminobacter sp. JC074]|uniref:IGHMBP2 family helicase n=1 Tax=Acidaminobacter sp. JC074 TaxID=2530199 RepID=UPI001F0E946E|nr:IGHMBP2 family helicase [Acidaminobacter sp. JC074]
MDYQVKTLINNMLRSVEYEREEERDRHFQEMKYLSGLEREKKGRAIINLKKRKSGRTLSGEHLYIFSKGERIETEINVGDQVLVSLTNPLDQQNPTAIVYEVSHKSITLAFSRQPRFASSKGLRIDLAVNDTTYKRMEEALLNLRSPQYSKLHKILSGQYGVNTSLKEIPYKDLNERQSDAISQAFNNNGYYSIQGPPGTGKTYTAAHLIHWIVKQGKKVLITADSNAAVDHLIRNCIKLGLDPLRIGNPIRVNKDLKSYTLDYRIYEHVLYGEVTSLQDQLEEVKELQKGVERPSNKDTRGYTYTELIELLESNQSGRGISKQTIKDMKPFLKLQKKMDALYSKIQKLRDQIQSDILYSHQIIASTNATAGCDLLVDAHFDWVIMDEAAQASMPSAMIPILKCNRFVLVGDHYQLPPVVINQEAKELGLDQSLMDYLADKYPYYLSQLNVQYRMHEEINNLVSSMFYNDQLIPAKQVRKRRVMRGDIIETIQVGGKELMQKDSKSFYNQQEIDMVGKQIKRLLKYVKEDQIAVISPYKAQAKKLQKLYPEIEIDTVDAFQGREKDVVIISFVRSNPSNNIGFLKDFRRLNVSISRAKSKLILIGNLNMIRHDDMYDYLLEMIQEA